MQESTVYTSAVSSLAVMLVLTGAALANPASWLSSSDHPSTFQSADDTTQPGILPLEEEDDQANAAVEVAALETSKMFQEIMERLLGDPQDNPEDSELQRVIHLQIEAVATLPHSHPRDTTPSKVQQTHSQLTVSPSALNFGTIQINETKEITLTITNEGAQTLTCYVTTSLPHSIISDSSFTLVSGASHTVTLRFRPISPGIYLANAAVSSDGNTTSVMLKGIAKRPS